MSQEQEPLHKTQCPICQEVCFNTNITKTSCGHHFCYRCLHNWLSYNNSCPMCRKRLGCDDLSYVFNCYNRVVLLYGYEFKKHVNWRRAKKLADYDVFLPRKGTYDNFAEGKFNKDQLNYYTRSFREKMEGTALTCMEFLVSNPNVVFEVEIMAKKDKQSE